MKIFVKWKTLRSACFIWTRKKIPAGWQKNAEQSFIRLQTDLIKERNAETKDNQKKNDTELTLRR